MKNVAVIGRRLISVLAVVVVFVMGFSTPSYAATPARFVFEYPPAPDQFVIELTDPEKIQQARDILSGKEKDKTHVLGRIIKRPADYNSKWDYQLDPSSISFFSYAIEVCDAQPRYVEDHLDEVGGAFLPGFFWCPWNSRLVREVSSVS